MKAIAILGVAALTVSVFACRDKSNDAASNTTTAAELKMPTLAPLVTPQQTREPGESAGAPTTSPTPGPNPADSLSDGQIVAIMHVANTEEITLAKLAQDKSKSSRVKKFATVIAQERSKADAKAMDLLATENLLLTDSATGSAMKTDGDHFLAELGVAGAAFDVAYARAEVADQQSLLDTIDTKLLPSVYDQNVRACVLSLRERVTKDLDRAHELESDLEK